MVFVIVVRWPARSRGELPDPGMPPRGPCLSLGQAMRHEHRPQAVDDMPLLCDRPLEKL
jgi:hypothetical protein